LFAYLGFIDYLDAPAILKARVERRILAVIGKVNESQGVETSVEVASMLRAALEGPALLPASSRIEAIPEGTVVIICRGESDLVGYVHQVDGQWRFSE